MKLKGVFTMLLLLFSGCQTSATADIPSLIESGKPSLVRVVVVESGQNRKPTPHVLGTGFIVAPGRVATAAHIVKDLPKGSIFLVPADQETFDFQQNSAEVVVLEIKHDLALLQCPALKDRPALQLHRAEDVKMGEDAIVLGFPLADPTLTVTRAMIAATSKKQLIEDNPALTDMFKLDATINMGNSGGPVIHVPSGKVIGRRG